MEYSSEVRRRLERPSCRGVLASAAGAVSATAEDRSLNVWVRVEVEVDDEILAAARYDAYGCPHFLAGADWIVERLAGQPVAALTEVASGDAVAALDVPTAKRGKLLVVEDALAACAAQLSR
jgi:NifU-like protein involved in Fe-S cluster formation